MKGIRLYMRVLCHNFFVGDCERIEKSAKLVKVSVCILVTRLFYARSTEVHTDGLILAKMII